MEHISYKTSGVCSRSIEIDYEGDKIVDMKIIGGCSGNTQGVCALSKGQKIDDVISKLEGIKCGFKPTSCPDQVAKALKTIKK